MKLGQAFDPRRNALNAWRLTLATGVILWHSFPLTGHHIAFQPVHQLLRDAWVDGFFAISGFLITWSWLSNPRLCTYLVARGLRILPGLWLCLIITAFVIAPVSVAIQGGPAAKLLLSRAPLEYVLKNCAVLMAQLDVGGTPRGVLFAGNWNGSLWTLIFEVLCYIAVAVLGLVGLLNRRWFIPAALALMLFWSTRLPPWYLFAENPAAPQQHVDAAKSLAVAEASAARLFTMFFAGALLYQFRNVIPARWSLVAVCFAVVIAASALPNYRLIGAIPLAYAIIVSGTLIRHKRLRLRTDFSYGVYIYAFPVQQLLIIGGLGTVNPIVFAIIAAIATFPLAALSWFLVEKPALSLKARLKQKSIAKSAERGPTQPVPGPDQPELAEPHHPGQ
ncbi:acyltransferase family protein [Mycobacterium xenopi]|uniref:Acyltransferase n=2 Tax=Mycobacterium xenopi TaxID=1789 RepID=A0AAD1GW64_MYCXE|nr:acyltransferase [Mycobacterium xenopi]EUA32978.1 acyltransferase family protein [Mycobacterium xenopi 4042]MDA3642193.1 acyltransferase [Mycobacterium xenopi]MDA3660289.1 acyltransferase [Mycobacterium xenopi]SPX79675.1 putative acyltransferase [Mycobacterium xenopi]BBU20397.1 acyltransferase [Mycobacterium xenopi]